jgi:taurine dioxygenase
LPNPTPEPESDLGFAVGRLSGAFGGEVGGFDLRRLIDAPSRAAFVRCLAAHGLLVFRDQTLTPGEFAAVSRSLGELEFHVLDQYRMAAQPEIYVISNIVEDGKPIGNPRDGFGWHTDQSYIARPTAYTILHGVETPPVGADTQFASTYLAYETLPAALRATVDRLRGIHSYVYMRTRNAAYMGQNTKVTLTTAQVASVPDVVHPLVRTHPLTGRRSLYLGGDCLAGILDMPEQAARPLIEELFEIALRPEYRFVHRWRPRDVVMWDNRGLMHTATEYDRDQHRRLIWRTSVRGEVPV